MKIKITGVVTKIYDLNPDYYPDGFTPAQMMEIDLKSADEDAVMFFEDGEWAITGELYP